MINNKYILVYDLETSHVDPRQAGIVQIAAVVLHPRTLEVVAEFNRDNIKWRPNDAIDDKAFAVTRKDKKYIEENGIEPKQAWMDFTNFVQRFNKNKSSFNAPMPAGYNIVNYDNIILSRYCADYGPWDDKKDCQGLVSSYMRYDLLEKIFWLTESTDSDTFPDIKLTTIGKYLGLNVDEAHDALIDTRNCAKIIAKFIRLERYLFPKIKMKDVFKNEE